MAKWPDPPPVKDQWDVGNLTSYTAVPRLSAKESVENTWWEWVVEARPMAENVDYKKGTKQQRREFDNRLLVMVSQPGRVDWTVEVTEPKPEPSDPYQVPSLGSMSNDTLTPFIELNKKWLDVCPEVEQLGFQTSLGKIVPGAGEGIDVMQKYLPSVKMGEQNIDDFFYQVNRPRNSTSGVDTVIHRTSRWSALPFSTVDFATGTPTDGQMADVPEPYYCKLELYITTDVFEDRITGDAADAVFQELVEQGLEIATKGDTS